MRILIKASETFSDRKFLFKTRALNKTVNVPFVILRPNSTTSEMRKILRENTLVRKISLVVISTAEKKFAKTQAFDWFRYSVIQNTNI